MCDEKAMQILREIKKARSFVGNPLPTKTSGAITMEVVREYLSKEFKGHLTATISRSNVFIKEIPGEHDLLVVKKTASPTKGIIYEATDVICIIEIKTSGHFSKPEIAYEKIRQQRNNVLRNTKKGTGFVFLTVYEHPRFVPPKEIADYVFALFKTTRPFNNLDPDNLRPSDAQCNELKKLIEYITKHIKE